MATILFTHPDCLNHVNPPGHPEQVARLEHIAQALSTPQFAALLREQAPLGRDSDIGRCHPQAYIDRIEAALPDTGFARLDADTSLSPGSMLAARRAVGANISAVERVLAGDANNAFVACRPPGHHAETATAMGFCLFGNVSIAAKYALETHGLSRVAIVDFDVHHGNGTQDLMWNEPRALFCSSHQMPLYPGSGAASETGACDNIVNVPLAPDSGREAMRTAYDQVILPRIAAFEPELILISAGFDAHAADPLAQLNWQTDDFTWLTRRICDVADAVCDGRVVSTLEGGYDLKALAESSAAHVRVLMERGQ